MFGEDFLPPLPVNELLSDELVLVGLAEGDVSGHAVLLVKLRVHLDF